MNQDLGLKILGDVMHSHEHAHATFRPDKTDKLTVTVGPRDEQFEIVTSLGQSWLKQEIAVLDCTSRNVLDQRRESQRRVITQANQTIQHFRRGQTPTDAQSR